MTSSDKPQAFFSPKRTPRLTPGEIAMGVTYESKGVDPDDNGKRTSVEAATRPNPSAHAGHILRSKPPVDKPDYSKTGRA